MMNEYNNPTLLSSSCNVWINVLGYGELLSHKSVCIYKLPFFVVS
jgi:hypothetical protein